MIPKNADCLYLKLAKQSGQGRADVAAGFLLVFRLTSCFVSVVQTLAHNSTATLSVIKDYLVNKLQKQSRQIEQDEQRIQKYREETTRIRKEIEELKARCGAVWFLVLCRAELLVYFIKEKYTLSFLPPLTLSVPRSFRRPSVAFAPVP